MAVREDTNGATVLYGAWNETTKKLVGLLSVEKAAHPGDVTDAYGEVNGQQVIFENDTFTGVKAPVTTWAKAVKFAVNS